MANAYQSTEWIVDTAASTVLTTDPVSVKGIRWVGATTAGHTAVVTDAAGKVKWASVASGANYVESDNLLSRSGPGPWIGLVVPTLASGKLYIEFQ